MANLTIPHSFTSNTSILSAQVNANFAAVASKINGNILQDSFGTFTGAVSWSISSNVLAQSVSSSSTEGVVSISATGVLGSGKSGIKLTSAAAQTTGDAGLYVYFSSASSSIPAALFQTGGTGRVLKVVSTTAPSIPAPSMTTTQRDAITGAASDQVYNSTNKRPEFHDGTAWRGVGSMRKVVSLTMSATYTVLGDDDIIFCDMNGAVRQVTLPTASSHAGRSVTISKISSDQYTLTVTDSTYTAKLATQNEVLVVASDGTAWRTIERRNAVAETTYTPTLSSDVNTSANTAKYWREGGRMHVRGYVSWSGAGSDAGTFTVSTPTGFTIDTARLSSSSASSAASQALGVFEWYDNGTQFNTGAVTYCTNSTVQFARASGAAYLAGTSFANGDGLKYQFSVPITDWEA
jgi:hypothetical protein